MRTEIETKTKVKRKAQRISKRADAAVKRLFITLSLVTIILSVFSGGVAAAGDIGAAKESTTQYCVGGIPFGVRFFTEGVMVVGFTDVDTGEGQVNPAKEAGLLPKDIILKINGVDASSAEQVIDAISKSNGKAVTIVVKRSGAEKTITITPVKDKSGIYRAGIWIRDSTAGIGTVTFYNPKTGAFAGLGHGICDSDTGELMPLLRGTITKVTLSGITKGVAGTPGELRGCFSAGKIGTLVSNTYSGVYGVLTQRPANGEFIELASRDKVRNGPAKIRCTLKDGVVGEYDVVLSDVKNKDKNGKSFVIVVTDPVLLELTGGIVQGMSGSPVIQDGKLVGAVTHVMINDPKCGYGIFIENMLDNMPEMLK